ncbi:RNA-directed DNA polymerase (Reverse transcriptase), partial [Trifolium medium]|nr:RNA-directed DNA polymerase (Reverse transcriptase) [Trifolium medium]
MDDESKPADELKPNVVKSCCPLAVWHGSLDVQILFDFKIQPVFLHPPNIITVIWHAPTTPWRKVNTDCSLLNNSISCGAIFRDSLGSYLGSFFCRMDYPTILHVELFAITLAIEQAQVRGNVCADKLADICHSIQGFHWWGALPQSIKEDFHRDR